MRSRGRLTALLLGAALTVVTLLPGSGIGGAPEAARGEKVFTLKHCARCHRARGQESLGPPREELIRPQGAYELAGRIWNHAPAMFTVLGREGLAWPRISEDEMADLMTYLGADPRRDPQPDLYQGQATLVRKGCLKCHPFRGEGGRFGPDLAKQRRYYAPPPRWAATLWDHAPAMAKASLEREVLFPTFSGDEMANLVEYLRRWK